LKHCVVIDNLLYGRPIGHSMRLVRPSDFYWKISHYNITIDAVLYCIS